MELLKSSEVLDLRTLKTSIDGKANSSHTHNYAGSSSAGGAANSANTLATARTINGTSFNGSANITTANWGTSRTLTIGNTAKSVNGSANVSWSLSEIGAAAASHGNHVPTTQTADARKFLRNDNTWQTLPSASTSATGIVQLNDATNSTSTTQAATANAVKKAYDRAEAAFQSASDGKTKIATAITGKGVSASSSDTFDTLSTKIGQIKTDESIPYIEKPLIEYKYGKNKLPYAAAKSLAFIKDGILHVRYGRNKFYNSQPSEYNKRYFKIQLSNFKTISDTSDTSSSFSTIKTITTRPTGNFVYFSDGYVKLYRYDIITETYTQMATAANGNAFNPGFYETDNFIFAFGGYYSSKYTYYDTVQKYDKGLNTFTLAGRMSKARGSDCAVVKNGNIFYVLGTDNTYDATSSKYSMERYDENTNTSTLVTNTNPLSNFLSLVGNNIPGFLYKNKFISIGGTISGYYDIDKDTFVKVDDGIKDYTSHTNVIMGDNDSYFYIMGGLLNTSTYSISTDFNCVKFNF